MGALSYHYKENQHEEILTSFLNGNRSWARTEVSNLNKEDFVEFNIFLLDMYDENVITKDDIRFILSPAVTY